MMNPSSGNDRSPQRKRPKLDRRNLQRIISDLVRRRQEHEERINKLLDPNYLHQDVTKSTPRGGEQEFSQMLRKLEAEEPQVLQESIGSLGNHVNLLATVSLKTDYFLVDKHHSAQEGELYPSLLSHHPRKQILYDFGREQPEGVEEWMRTLVRFLVEQQLTNGLFVLSQGEKGKYDFFGTRFQRGKYQQILLSKQQLEQSEAKLLIFSKKDGSDTINISWLLLARLLKPVEHLNFPLAVHRLFSFPYKKFHIRQSLQLIKFNELVSSLPLEDAEEHPIKMYGIEQNGQACEVLLPNGKNFKKYTPLLQRFQSLLLMNQTEFPSKSLPLSCLKNHFVVVTLILKAEEHYYISVGGQGNRMRFRLCLLDFEGHIVQHEIISSGQFMVASLREEEYELYISPEGSEEVGLLGEEESFELVKESQEQFWLWVQGRSVCTKKGDLQLEIRLKEQYNTYTLKIAKDYMQQWKEGEGRNSPDQPTSSPDAVVVKRYVLGLMGLVVDQFVAAHRKLTVKYKENNLCDQYFQENAVCVGSNECIVLRTATEIECILLLGNQIAGTVLSFSVFTYFI